MGSFNMEATQINYRRDETFKTVDQKLQELSQESAIDTDIAPVFKSTNTYAPGDMVYYRNKLYTCTTPHSGAWAAADFTATDVTTAIKSAAAVKADEADIASAFDATVSYAVGDLVYYNGTIYRCTNAHEGDWDADDFSATTISGELSSLMSGLIDANSNILSLSGLLAKHIGIFASGETLLINDNIRYVKITVPIIRYITLHGVVFSRYGAHSIMIRTNSSGAISDVSIEQLIMSEGITASISYSGNEVTMDLGGDWSSATLVLVQPYLINNPNIIENITVTFLPPS